jgi:hypothetical protein
MTTPTQLDIAYLELQLQKAKSERLDLQLKDALRREDEAREDLDEARRKAITGEIRVGERAKRGTHAKPLPELSDELMDIIREYCYVGFGYGEDGEKEYTIECKQDDLEDMYEAAEDLIISNE